ncbi:MAG: aspartate--tRNA ligase, partial [Alphaproteobacteria bacterium]|nr:aspartate--tRNA ligase [Alphaproteobacteria bacterium]
ISLLQEFAPDGTWNTEIERIPYETAMLKYGSDKPDLRIPIEISDVSEIFRDSEFTIFADAVKAGKVVRAIPAPKTAGNPRSYFDKCEEFAKTELGLLGLGYIVFGEEEVKGPIAKKLTPEQIESIRVKAGVSKGDSIFFVCEEKTTAAKASGKLRKRFGAEIGLNPREFKICWIVDFPFYEKDEESGQIMFGHNPFGLPQGDIQNLDLSDPLALKAIQYDFVMNGEEIGGGGLRNYCRETMVKLFAIAGYDEQVIIDKFGGMYEVFKYGAIPTGGIAWGMERIVCLLLDEPNLREITAFPPNQKGQDLMMGSPNTPTEIQLRETHIQFRKKG